MKNIFLFPFQLLRLFCVYIVLYLFKLTWHLLKQPLLFILKQWFLFRELYKRKMLKRFFISKIPSILKKSNKIEEFDLAKKFKFKNLEQYKIEEIDSKIKIFIPFPITPSGKIQKECPDKECLPRRLFYIERHRIQEKNHQSTISTGSKKYNQSIITCPYCGIASNSKKFISQKDKQYILQTVIWAFHEDMRNNFYELFKNPKKSEKIAKVVTSDYIQSLYSKAKSKGLVHRISFILVKSLLNMINKKKIKRKYLSITKIILLYFKKPTDIKKFPADFKFKLEIKYSLGNLLKSKKYTFNPSDINPEISIGTYSEIDVKGIPISYGFHLPVSKPDVKPKIHREDLLRNIRCPYCSQRYGVYVIAFFCPHCGNKNLIAHFQKEKEIIENQIEKACDIKERDKELYHRLLGNVHEDTLTLFETYLKNIFYFITKKKNIEQKKLKTNTFQNLERIEEYYKEIHINPFISITNNEKEKLKHYIEVRHVIGHNLSMVDKKFTSKFPDYSEGTNVSISENEILRFILICEKIVVFLEKEIRNINSDEKESVSSGDSSIKSQINESFDTLFELLQFVHTMKKSRLEQDKKRPFI